MAESIELAKMLIKAGVSVAGAEEAQAAIDDVTGAAGGLDKDGGESLKKFEMSSGSAFKAIGIGAVALAGTVTGVTLALFEMERGFGEHAVELDKWGLKLGQTTTQVQRLDAVFRAFDVDVENGREGIKTLRENLGEMQRIGTGPAVDALGTLGIKLKDIADLDAEGQLSLFGEALRELPNDSQRLSVAIEAMGEDGAALLPVFQATDDIIREIGDSAESTGLILDEEAVQRGLAVAASFREANETWTASKNILLAELAPTLIKVAGLMGGLVEENGEFIKQDLPGHIDLIADSFGLMARAAVTAGKKTLEAWDDLTDGVAIMIAELSGDSATAALLMQDIIDKDPREGETVSDAAKLAAAMRAARELDKLLADANALAEDEGKPVKPKGKSAAARERERRRKKFQREELSKQNAGGKKKGKEEFHLTSFEQALQSTLGDGITFDGLKGVRTASLDPEKIRPESIINITNITNNNAFRITGSNGQDIANRTAAKLDEVNRNKQRARSASAQSVAVR